MTTVFSFVALIVLTGLGVFQIALIAGAPLGRFAWGGANTRLPRRLRIASITSIVLYGVFMVFVASKGGVVSAIPQGTILTIGMWIFTVYFFFGIVLNALSRSKPERLVMVPTAAILAISFLVVAL